MDVFHCEICAMLRTKDSSTDVKYTNVLGNEYRNLNECSVLKSGKVCESYVEKFETSRILGPYILGPYILGPYILGPYILGPYIPYYLLQTKGGDVC